MNNTTEIHPDAVFEAITAASSHPTKMKNLVLIRQVCTERYKLGNKDFSLKLVGEAVQARGGPKVKVLWNPQSADYRKLIEAWQAFAGIPHRLREIRKQDPEEALTKTIADPATRIIVGQLLRERKSLRAQLNILKSQSILTIDRRPRTVAKLLPAVDVTEQAAEQTREQVINELEREALEHAISASLWRDEGWREEKYGRVVSSGATGGHSRTIFKPGFVTGIRKILGMY